MTSTVASGEKYATKAIGPEDQAWVAGCRQICWAPFQFPGARRASLSVTRSQMSTPHRRFDCAAEGHVPPIECLMISCKDRVSPVELIGVRATHRLPLRAIGR